MFGGVGFLLHGNMLVGIWKTSLIVRLAPHQAEAALAGSHVVPFDITGRPMKGWVMVEPDGLETDERNREWKDILGVAANAAVQRRARPEECLGTLSMAVRCNCLVDGWHILGFRRHGTSP